ncbi:hypothetical protein DIPPA_16397 [Diplonema papillatum]|nr:hypothetical protein DIPPA_16397 [Diplonema papillatum]
MGLSRGLGAASQSSSIVTWYHVLLCTSPYSVLSSVLKNRLFAPVCHPIRVPSLETTSTPMCLLPDTSTTREKTRPTWQVTRSSNTWAKEEGRVCPPRQ